MMNILLIGPLPPPMGGDTRHFRTLYDDLRSNSRFRVRLIDTSRGVHHSRVRNNLWVVTRTFFLVLRNLRWAHLLSYHSSDRGMLLFGPVITWLGKLSRRPTILRAFGGSFGDTYLTQGPLGQALIRRGVLASDVFLLQTRRSIRQLEPFAVGRLEWFSTYVRTDSRFRERANEKKTGPDRRCSRFVYLGHLWRTKGIELLLEAAPELPAGVTIDLYGTPDEYSPEQIAARGGERVRYKGFLTHEQVDEKLWEYDCLLLPTRHPGEGYPGAIAEAFVHGLPVITTNWLAIPEMVDDSCGILIEPGQTRDLVSAMTRLHHDRSQWLQLCQGAARRGAEFDHSKWARAFEGLCEQLVQQSSGPRPSAPGR